MSNPSNRIDDPLAYFRERIVTDGACWRWTGTIQNTRRGGYGTWPRTAAVRHNLSTLAHRALYVILVGAIPEGLQLDHLCRNRWCVNPDHLEPVTQSVNLRRSPLTPAGRTECVNGHAFDEANTYRHGGRRQCRACNTVRVAAYAARKRATA